jgi:hypothetical protein
MNIAEFFTEQARIWTNELHCGFCWSFDLPLRESDAEEHKLSEDCDCVTMLLTDLSIQEVKTYVNNDPTRLKDFYENYSFTLSVVIPDIIGRQTYQENNIYPISESKWETILQPLKSCLSGDAPFDFCEIYGREVPITTSNWTAKIDWLSNNYTGWSISITLRTDGNPYIKKIV